MTISIFWPLIRDCFLTYTTMLCVHFTLQPLLHYCKPFNQLAGKIVICLCDCARIIRSEKESVPSDTINKPIGWTN